jgi:hypothetical protein
LTPTRPPQRTQTQATSGLLPRLGSGRPDQRGGKRSARLANAGGPASLLATTSGDDQGAAATATHHQDQASGHDHRQNADHLSFHGFQPAPLDRSPTSGFAPGET